MYYNTGNLVSYIYNTGCTSNVHLQYWNTRIVDLFTIPEAPVFFIQQYCYTSIAKHTIMEAPVFFIQQYW